MSGEIKCSNCKHVRPHWRGGDDYDWYCSHGKAQFDDGVKPLSTFFPKVNGEASCEHWSERFPTAPTKQISRDDVIDEFAELRGRIQQEQDNVQTAFNKSGQGLLRAQEQRNQLVAKAMVRLLRLFDGRVRQHTDAMAELLSEPLTKDADWTAQRDIVVSEYRRLTESPAMVHGTYIGDQPVLKGKTAILKEIDDPNQGVTFYPSAFILAQFDDIYDLGVGLTHTWTLWKRTDWEVDAEE